MTEQELQEIEEYENLYEWESLLESDSSDWSFIQEDN